MVTPIPLVAPVISAVLLMIYHLCRNHFIDFVIIFLEMQFVLNLRYIFTHAFCPDGKPIFFSRSNSTALINDCILHVYRSSNRNHFSGMFNTQE
jgi:hypothetical protein